MTSVPEYGGSAAELYCIQWQPSVPAAPASEPAVGRWAVVAEPHDARATALVERLLAAGRPCHRASFDAVAQVLPAEHVVCLWGAGDAALEPPDAALASVNTAVRVVQRLVGEETAPLRLFWVTTDAQAVTSTDRVASLPATAVWGVGRAVRQEQQELECVLLDVGAGESAATDLWSELVRSDDEDEVAWRDGHRFVARLDVAGESATPSRPLRTDGSVLITGGLGELGVGLARHFARSGVRHLILTGRRGMTTPGVVNVVAELESLGAAVHVAAVDAADRDALARTLADVPSDRPLRAIVHAAGVFDRGLLPELTPQRAEVVLRPKAHGAWNLHELSRGVDLDALILCSSIGGTFVAGGQAHYAAANAFVDGLASHRRCAGQPAQSLVWGVLADPNGRGVGMASELDHAHVRRATRNGLVAVDLNRATALFARAIRCGKVGVVPVPIDLAAARTAFGGAVPPLWRHLVDAEVDGAGEETWQVQFAALDGTTLLDRVTKAVTELVVEVLLLDDVADVEPDQPLTELGLDSLGAVELCKTLSDAVGVEIENEVPFDHPTAEELAAHLIQSHFTSNEESLP